MRCKICIGILSASAFVAMNACTDSVSHQADRMIAFSPGVP